MIASHNGHTDIVQLLLKAGADKEAKNEVREERGEITYTHAHTYTHEVDERCSCDGLFTALLAEASTCTP